MVAALDPSIAVAATGGGSEANNVASGPDVGKKGGRMWDV